MTNPYYLNPFRAFLGLTTAWKAAVVITVLVLLSFATNGVGRAVEAYRDSNFDRKVAEKQQEIDQLTKQRDALIQAAREKEAQAVIVEREADQLRQLINERGGRLAQEEEKITDAFKTFKTDSDLTSADVPDDLRRQRLCAKLRASGFQCE